MGRKLLERGHCRLCDFGCKLSAETGDALAERIRWQNDMAAIGCGTKRPVEQSERGRHFNVEARDRRKAPVTVMVRGRNGSDTQERDPSGCQLRVEVFRQLGAGLG